MSRWDSFTTIELIVINEALNDAFEEGKYELPRWYEEAQRIAATIPAPDREQKEHILEYLNQEPS